MGIGITEVAAPRRATVLAGGAGLGASGVDGKSQGGAPGNFRRGWKMESGYQPERKVWRVPNLVCQKARMVLACGMKTTLDIPNDLYREVKAVAALERIRIKDLVAEGLQLALAERAKGKRRPTPLEALEDVRRRPLHPSQEIAGMMEDARRQRHEGWDERP
jgi:hypothetical protein